MGPPPHPVLQEKEAASIFRAIMREPLGEQTSERMEAAHQASSYGRNIISDDLLRDDGNGEQVLMRDPAVPAHEMDLVQYRRALHLVGLRLGLQLRVHARLVSHDYSQGDDPLVLLPPTIPVPVDKPWWKRGEKEQTQSALENGVITPAREGAGGAHSGRGGGPGSLDAPPRQVGRDRARAGQGGGGGGHRGGTKPPLPPNTQPTNPTSAETSGGLLQALSSITNTSSTHVTAVSSASEPARQAKGVSLFSLREHEIAAVRASFHSRGGTLELEDLADVFRIHLGFQLSESSLRSLFSIVDVNTTGQVSWKEFAEAVLLSSLATLRATSVTDTAADQHHGLSESSLFEKGVTTSWLPSSDGWGVATHQPPIGSRSDTLVGAAFVADRDVVACVTLQGHVSIIKATTGSQIGTYRLPAVPLLPTDVPPTPRRHHHHATSPASTRFRAPPNLIRPGRAASASQQSVSSSNSSTTSLETVSSSPSGAFTRGAVGASTGIKEAQRNTLGTPRHVSTAHAADVQPISAEGTNARLEKKDLAHDSSPLATGAALFNVPSHVVSLCALRYGKISSSLAIAMTDGSLRFFDVSINAQTCEYKVAHRGDALVTALDAFQLVNPHAAANRGGGGGGGKKQESNYSYANMLAVGDQDGVLRILNMDTLERQVAQGCSRASSACLEVSKHIFAAESQLKQSSSTSKECDKSNALSCTDKLAITVILYVPHLRALVVGAAGGRVVVVDLDGIAYQVTTTFNHHLKAVRAVEYIVPYKYIVSGCKDRDIFMWEPRTGRRIGTLRGHLSSVLSIAFHPDTEMLISLDVTSVVKWWSVTSETVLKSYKALSDPFLTHRMPIVGMMLAKTQTGSHAGKDSLILCCNRVRIWRLRAPNSKPKPKTENVFFISRGGGLYDSYETYAKSDEPVASVDDVAAAGDGGNGGVHAGGEGGEVEENTNVSKPGRMHTHPIVAVLVSSAKKCIIAADASGLVCVWDAITAAQITWFEAEVPAKAPKEATHANSSTNSRHNLDAKDSHVTLNRTRPFEIVRKGGGG